MFPATPVRSILRLGIQSMRQRAPGAIIQSFSGRQKFSTTTITSTTGTPASSSAEYQRPYQATLADLDHQLSEVKVFQEEQIIQLSFESGKSINYTMRWLRNLCSCPTCLAIRSSNPVQYQHPVTQQKLSVANIQCESNRFIVEWLEQDEYRFHRSVYQVKYLSSGAQ